MKPKKETAFNLCDFDLLDLTFVNRKGRAIYSIGFDRAFADHRHRKARKESEQTQQRLHFTHYDRVGNAIEMVNLDFTFRTIHAPRVPDAKTVEQRIKLDRPLEISIEGADGASFGTFHLDRPGGEAQFSVNHTDGSGHSLMCFTPEKRFAEPRRREGVK